MPDSKATALAKITQKWSNLQKKGLDLGIAQSDVTSAGYGGWYRIFEKGRIYSHQTIGTYEVHGNILNVYLRRKAYANNPTLGRREFGFPKSDEARTPDQRFSVSHFEWGQIISLPGTWGGVAISGEIYKAWIKSPVADHLHGLGYPINGNVKKAGGEIVFFERGLMYYNKKNSSIPVQVTIEPPLIGNPAIIKPDQEESLIEVTAPQRNVELMGGPNVLVQAVQNRFYLQKVGSNIRIPLILSLSEFDKQVRFSFSMIPGHVLENRTLYDLVFKMDNGRFYPFSPHAFYARDNWIDFSLIHATDIHVARRIDTFRSKLVRAKEKYKRTDLDEGIKHLNNWNDGFRDLICYANSLHEKGLLDGIIATGDLVDYLFEDRDNRKGGGNFEFFRQLILGKVKYPDSSKKQEELKIPIFTTLGNHDYRPNAYKLIFGVGPGGAASIKTVRLYSNYNINETEARAIQDGRPPKTINTPAGLQTYSYGRPTLSFKGAERMIKTAEPMYYFRYINSRISYMVKLGKHRLVMLDAGPDVGLPEGFWDALKTAFGNSESEDKATIYKGTPNTRGFKTEELNLTSIAQKETQGQGLIIIGTHSPLINTKGSEYPHYFRETEHPTADEKEVANYLRRQVPIHPQPFQNLTNAVLLKRVKKEYKDWPLKSTSYFKTGDHKNLMDWGVSRGEIERFLKLCVGINLSNRLVRPVDLILFGHAHSWVEIRLKWDRQKQEFQYYNDFYSENPSVYYSSNKYKGEFGAYKRVYIRLVKGAVPNGKVSKIKDSFWGESLLLKIPNYSHPLNESKNPVQWWEQHRPLFIRGAPLGPSDNNTRRDKNENKNRPDPSFEGCKLIEVQNDTIARISQVSRNEVSKDNREQPIASNNWLEPVLHIMMK